MRKVRYWIYWTKTFKVILTLHLKQLEKEEQKTPKISRRKEIIKIQAEINEKEKKEPAFSFINLYYCFFFIYFCSDLYDFFPSTNFGGFFVLLFPVVLGVKLGCLFDAFLLS